MVRWNAARSCADGRITAAPSRRAVAEPVGPARVATLIFHVPDTPQFGAYPRKVPSPHIDQQVFQRLHFLPHSHRALDVRIEFLPPYSPDLNPIEEAFSKIKAFIRRNRAILAHEGHGMVFDLMQIMDVVTADDAVGYFIHAGYF